MNRKTIVRNRALSHAIVVLALMAGAASARSAGTDVAAVAFDAAMAAYERNHWDAAYTAFAGLADRDHPESARIALQMWRYGPTLYRASFVASAQQVDRWSRLWSRDSSSARR